MLMVREGVDHVVQARLEPRCRPERGGIEISILAMVRVQHRHDVVRIGGEMGEVAGQGGVIVDIAHLRVPFLLFFGPMWASPPSSRNAPRKGARSGEELSGEFGARGAGELRVVQPRIGAVGLDL